VEGRKRGVSAVEGFHRVCVGLRLSGGREGGSTRFDLNECSEGRIGLSPLVEAVVCSISDAALEI
jgi:hypothetical protein